MASSVVFLELASQRYGEKPEKLCLMTQYNTFVETNEFTVPGSQVIVKLKRFTNGGTSGPDPLVQVHLVEPANDIISVSISRMYEIPGVKMVLRSNSKSVMFAATMTDLALTAPNLNRYFSFTMSVVCPWKKIFMNLTPDHPSDVVIRVQGKDISTTKVILTTKSDVFAAMFTHDTKEKRTGVVEITDFSFQVVQEMVRFLMHDYCTGWDGQYEKLAAIADKYDIAGMKKLAAEKKALLDQHP